MAKTKKQVKRLKKVTLDETWNGLWMSKNSNSYLRHSGSGMDDSADGTPSFIHCCLGVACLQAGVSTRSLRYVSFPHSKPQLAVFGATGYSHDIAFEEIASINDDPLKHRKTPTGALNLLKRKFRGFFDIELVVPKGVERMYKANWKNLTGRGAV